MKATIALPTWKNKDILWLPLEGLIRQKTTYPWELVVMECEGDSTELIESYKSALQKAGCTDVVYIKSHYRMPLAIKWKMMAEKATGDVFLLQASDDYHAKDRIQRTMEAFEGGVDWYQARYHYHYSFRFKKVIMFDMLTVQGWKATGFNMAMPTDLVRRIKDTQQPRGIDFYLFNSIEPKNVYNDECDPKGGCATDGLNTISVKRYKFYENIVPPFHPCDKGVDQIGLPKTISDRIQNTIAPDEIANFGNKLTGKQVLVMFEKNFKGRRAGYEYFVDSGMVDYLKYRGVVKGNGVKTETKKI